MSASGIISTLWAATSADKLNDEQLEKLCCAHEVTDNLSDLADMVMAP